MESILRNLGNMGKKIMGNMGNMTLSSSKIDRPSIEEFEYRFTETLRIIDYYAELPNAESLEADKALHESKVREHIKFAIHILQNEGELWKDNSQVLDPSVHLSSITPCLYMFIQRRYMQELCNRALRDRPRGCMPLIIAIITSLIKNVKYPLIHNQNIHMQICQLVSVTTRYESLYCSNRLTERNSTESAGYKRRLDANLVHLISTIWRRIADNPPLLDHFRFVDHRNIDEHSLICKPLDSPKKMRSQLDIITALIPLLNSSRVGSQAREAIIIAFSMHDSRIERFVVLETNLLDTLISDLCIKFQKSIEFCQVQLSSQSMIHSAPTVASLNASSHDISINTNGPNARVSPSTPNQTMKSTFSFASRLQSAFKPSPMQPKASNLSPLAVNESTTSQNAQSLSESSTPSKFTLRDDKDKDSGVTAIDHFIKSLVFCNSLITASTISSASGHPGSRRQNSDILGVLSRDSHIGEVLSMGTTSVPVSTTSSMPIDSEPKVNIKLELLQVYMDIFLQVHVLPGLLNSSEQHAVLAQIVTKKILIELSNVSMNSPLLSATASFLCNSSALMKMLLSRAGSVSRSLAVSSIQLINSLLATAPIEEAALLVLSTTRNNHGDNYGVEDCVDAINPTKYSPVSIPGLSMLDLELSRVCGAMAASKTVQQMAGSVSGIRLAAPDVGNEQREKEYIISAQEGILLRLSNRLSSMIFYAPSTCSKLYQENAHEDSFVAGCGRGFVLDLLHQKLSLLLKQKFDEQIAVSGLTERIVCLLCALTMGFPSDQRAELDRFNLVVDIKDRVEQIWEEINSFLTRIPDGAKKMELFKQTLTGTMHARILEKETPQSRKIIESAIVVQELLLEVKSHVSATRMLRTGFGEIRNETVVREILHERDAGNDQRSSRNGYVASDDFERAWETETNFNISTAVAQVVNEDDFMHDFEELQSNLDLITSPI